MAGPPASEIFRVRLAPPRLAVSSFTAHSYTKLSEGQVLAAQMSNLAVPTHWSIAPDMNSNIITALCNDLDSSIPTHPATPNIMATITRLQQDWQRNFGDNAFEDHSAGLEMTTSEASNQLLMAVVEIVHLLTNDRDSLLKRKPYAHSCVIDNSIKNTDDQFYVGVEDKRVIGSLRVFTELSRRVGCGALDTEIIAATDQPNWWIIVNKGALYAGAYELDWVIWAGVAAYCVGYRKGDHIFWSTPFINRRDANDELKPNHLNRIATLNFIFGNQPPPQVPQVDLLLLFLAVALRGAEAKGCAWVRAQFPNLCAVDFVEPSKLTQPHPEFSNTGSELDTIGDYDQKSSSSDSVSSGDNYSPPPKNAVCRATTSMILGGHRLSGKWYGDLGRHSGFSVNILRYHATGEQSMVYEGELLENSKFVSAVAIKVSEDTEALKTEFRKYRSLKQKMGDTIPRCYGLYVNSGGTAYLVTDLIPYVTPSRDLTKAERGAVYAALRKMHHAGWAHNDVVGSGSPRNLLWNSQGRPVLIDLFTATRHRCHAGCDELTALQELLKLKARDIVIWAQ
ncbi:hypothetical protein C8R43DRAFT_1126969 [Mycena crocata]|nr:hypothetical protein C8R43DRAFT_1126969 [Mycena crocata]